MSIPASVQTIVDGYLVAVDAAVPNLVEGLYLTGSVALHDFRPHSSDIDFVAVTAHRPHGAALDALARVHTQLHKQFPSPFFDGIYVTWDELACDPATLSPGPSSHEGRFQRADRFERNPITWHTLFQQGVRCHGPDRSDIGLWHDPAILAAWTNDNLAAYWQPLIERGQRLFTRHGIATLSAWSCVWHVLGVTRLHYTLATGRITSKEGAGRYSLETFAETWHRVIHEALRIRRGESRGSLYWSPLRRRHDVARFSAMVIRDARRIYASSQLPVAPT